VDGGSGGGSRGVFSDKVEAGTGLGWTGASESMFMTDMGFVERAVCCEGS